MKTILEKQRELIEEFQEIEDWRERYRAIIECGSELPALPSALKTDANLIRECQNRVWLAGRKEDKDLIFYFADGESQIVKGLAAMLVDLYSGHTANEILNTPAEYVEALGLGENLTRNRSNGLTALVGRVKRIALTYQLLEQGAKRG